MPLGTIVLSPFISHELDYFSTNGTVEDRRFFYEAQCRNISNEILRR